MKRLRERIAAELEATAELVHGMDAEPTALAVVIISRSGGDTVAYHSHYGRDTLALQGALVACQRMVDETMGKVELDDGGEDSNGTN